MSDIRTSGGREKLPIDADKIVWHKHSIGQYVGFRKTSADLGMWWARVRDPATGKQHYRSLGEFAEHQPAKRYAAALKAAIEWFGQADAGVTPHRQTVADACAAYVKLIRRTSEAKARRTEADFRRFVEGDSLAKVELGKLKRAHLDEWRSRISVVPARLGRGKRVKATPRAPATINRDIVPLRAALNLALEGGLVVSDLAWRVALKPIKDADRRRSLYLEKSERAKLLASAPDEVRPFLRGLAVLPLRPGALASLTVADFNPKLKTLRIGVDKTAGERWVRVPDATAEFFAEQAKGKLPAAPLISTRDGGHWTKDRWKRPVAAAVLAAKLPAATTAYTLRHSVITDLVHSGLDLLTIAQISGTSVAMIEKHYGHLRQDRASQALATLSL